MIICRIITVASTAALVLSVSAALGGCGTDTAPPATSSVIAQAPNQADIAFAQGMIPHHAQAIAMSTMAAQRTALPSVKDLAARIQGAQQPEIDQLNELLRAWEAPAATGPQDGMRQMDHGTSAAMPGMMSGDQMRQLGQASGTAFDRLFLQMMITYHQGAVTMAKIELSDGQNPEARHLAQRIIGAQQREITEMHTLLGG